MRLLLPNIPLIPRLPFLRPKKTFSSIPREPSNNLDTVQLSVFEEELREALETSGFLSSFMLTLSAPLEHGHVNDTWFLSALKDMLIAYRKKYNVLLQYQIVQNRGYAGTGAWSAHIVWKNEYPRNVSFLENWWNSKFGAKRAKVSYHSQCLRYYVKNMNQPDARTQDGSHNLTANPTKKRWRHRGRK